MTLPSAVADFGATCLFCCNDLMALGAIDRFRELGIAIPADISIIGYDNIVKRFGLLTRLTTVEQNVSELASQSWQCLYRHIQHMIRELRRGERFAAARTTVGRGRHRRAGADFPLIPDSPYTGSQREALVFVNLCRLHSVASSSVLRYNKR